MYNPNVMKPGVWKKNDIPYHPKEYFSAFRDKNGSLMFVSRKSFKTANQAAERAGTICARWRQAYQDTLNFIMAEAEAKKEPVSVQPDMLAIETEILDPSLAFQEKNHVLVQPADIKVTVK